MSRPVIPVTLSFSLGIFAGLSPFFDFTGIVVFIFCYVFAFLTFIILMRATFPALRRGALPVFLFGSFLTLGLLYCKAYEAIMMRNPLEHFEDRYVSIDGTILAIDEIKGIYTLKVRVHCIQSGREEVGVKGKACVQLRGMALEDFVIGDLISVRGKLIHMRSFANPGLYDYERALCFKGCTHVLYVNNNNCIMKRGTGNINPFMRAASVLKKSMQRVIYRDLPEQHASLLCGIIFGDRGKLSETLNNAFADTGTLHILAASGMNVGIIVIFMLGVTSRLGISQKWGSIAALPLIIVYTFMAGTSACIVRASIMACFGILAIVIERRNDMANILFVAALIMILWNPFTLFDIGFQLSFVAVIGIIFVSPLLDKYFSRTPVLIKFLSELFFLSFGIQIFLIPILAYYFNRISLFSPLCNIFIVPPAGILLNMGILEGLLGIFWHPLSIPFAVINRVLLVVLTYLVNVFSSIPFCCLDVVRPSWMAILVYYAVLYLLLYYLKNSRLPSILLQRNLLVIVLITVLLWVTGKLLARPWLKVVFLDVGEGDAIWLSLPSGENVLLDGGDLSERFDMGEKVVLPVLRAHGVNKLEFVILSHPHDDHIGGLFTVINSMKVGEFIEGKKGVGSERYVRLKRLLHDRGIDSSYVRTGDAIYFPCGAVLTFLAPFACSSDNVSENPNNDSVVCRLTYGEIKLLFMGDLEASGERELIGRGGDLHCDVIKVSHHGSDTSTTGELIDAASPKFAIISARPVGIKKHPSPSTLARLDERGVTVYRTDIDGAVIILTNGKEIKIKTCRNGR